MKKILFCLLMAGALLFVPYSAIAYQMGEKELTLTGIGSSDDNLDGTDLNVGGSLGYFMTDAISVAIRQDLYYVDLPRGDAISGSTRLAMDFHLNVAEVMYPFIGAQLGYVYGDMFRDQFVAGPEIGLKYFANQTTFIFGVVEYQFLFKKAKEIDDNFDDGRFVYGLGIGFKW